MFGVYSVTYSPRCLTLLQFIIFRPSKKMRLTTTSKIILTCVLVLALISIFQTYKRLIKMCSVNKENKINLKYILQWTSSKNIPFAYMGEGRSGFIIRNCPYTNCVVTSNRTLLGDYRKFDVIAFAGPELVEMMIKGDLPVHRSFQQKYIFASIESSHNYPICTSKFDNYFNWTWTYKLDSEVRWGYIVIKDSNNNIIGPNKDMYWLDWEDMEPVDEELKRDLNSKSKVAAWFVSNCYSKSNRETYVMKLKKELTKYNLRLDIYGDCGNLKCPREKENECAKMIAKDYFFYLSFENAFSEDYVTEKLIIALQNNAVPIVYGGANYSRFLPKGSYLDARQLGVERLAMKMNNLISNPAKYAEYFRWKKHYSYHKTSDSVTTNEYCRFCELLNDADAVKRTSLYENFHKWWDPAHLC